MPRLFTGLEIPSDLAFDLAMLRGGISGARWIDTENYHLTLRFIGDIDDATARDVFGALEGIRRSPFTVRSKGLTPSGAAGRGPSSPRLNLPRRSSNSRPSRNG